jgi:hypothetical protein
MPFSINEIKSQLALGGARSSLFQVTITNPVNAISDLKLPFLCRAAEIPESALGVVQVPYFGRKINVAGNRTFSPWRVTIINDEDFLIRNAMEQWTNGINSLQGNLNTLGASPNLYKSQAIVVHYAKTGLPIRTYQFNGIFPVSVSAIDLDWSNTDSIEEFNVTFEYDNYEVLPGITGNAGGV